MDILDQLREIVGQTHVLNGDDAERYSADWLKQYHWTPLAVVRPSSTDEVARVVEFADQNKLSIVPMGGNTGLTGATRAEDCIVISLERMSKIREIRKDAKIAIVEAGAILSNVHSAVDDHDLVFPLTFGAKGSATIGGVIGTNAGGSNVLRYGNTRDLILGLEVVTPTGQVMDLMSELHKDNSGYNLRNLIIGAEGSLGIVTAAVLKLATKPRAYATAMVAVRSLADALRLLNDFQANTGGAVEAFEYMPKAYIDRHLDKIPGARAPFDDSHDINIMVEVGTTIPAMAQSDETGQTVIVSELQSILESMFEDGAVIDAVVAQNEAQRREMWERREAAAELTLTLPNLINNDVAVPLDKVESFLSVADDKVASVDVAAHTFVVAHLGDGNIHYSVSASQNDPSLKDAIMEAVEDVVLEFKGSFSAEHGIGTSKLSSMRRRKDAVSIEMMRQIKNAIDPNETLNPGKLLP
ncbi:MAG: FAD-binding oxidoreductase [Rhodobacteraceae bacterium]|nr:FAD-binding oxidoreductase [Paracoccaceae bacterium]